MKTRKLLGIIAIGLGLSLALVWLLGSWIAPSIAAPAPSEAREPAENILQDATPIHYVAITGTDSGDCSAPTAACRTVQYAVDQAGEGDEVRVAAGTYTDVSARAATTWPVYVWVTQTVYISKTVAVRGGYTTTDWTTSDPGANPTTLDAQGQGRVVYITGNVTPTIEGLRITGGDGGADPGGGIYIHQATATITNNLVFSNTTTHHGGGIYLGGSSATLSDNTIFSNTGDWGGGVTLSNSPAVLSGNVISGNVASGDAGGGLSLRDSDATLTGNRIVSNATTLSGGAMYLDYSDAEITGNMIVDNSAHNALFFWHSDVTLEANIITHNDTGVFMHASKAILTNNVIADNQYSGMSIDGSSPRLLHNTFARNDTGVSITDRWQDGTYYTSTVALTNTILTNQRYQGIGVGGGNTAMVNGVLWHDSPITVSQATTATVTVRNQHRGDPVFSGDGYHLTAASAAIDAGVESAASTDVDAQSRPVGGTSLALMNLSALGYTSRKMPVLTTCRVVIS